MTEYSKEEINKKFEHLKLYDHTVKTIIDVYQYGDIDSFVGALKLMVVTLAEEKHDAYRRLVLETQNRKVTI